MQFGAAVATIVSEFSVAFCQTIALRKELSKLKPIIKYILIYTVASIAMYMTTRIIGNYFGEKITTILMQFMIGGGIYLIIVGIFFVLIKDEIIEKLLRKNS